MKVLCINNGPMKNSNGDYPAAPELTEGNPYTVVCVSELNENAYVLKEVDPAPGTVGFNRKRFVPLSDIDETEFIRHYQTETA